LRVLYSILLLGIGFAAQAQQSQVLRDSVNALFDVMRTEEDSLKASASSDLEVLIQNLYQNPENFDYELDSVPFLGQISSSDDEVKMTCWNVAFDDGSFQYHCVMRHRPNKRSVTVTVFEDTEDWQRINRKPVRPHKWYGVLYYKILDNKFRGRKYYTLLGWDGKDNITNRKVVDVMTIQGKSIILGSSIFEDENGRPTHRLIYEYGNDVSMALNYDEKEKMIIMDHLAPEDSRLEGQYQFYGPDFSYDALRFKKGKWMLVRDVFAKNRSLNNLDREDRPGSFKD
jgi:hypothetical protein